MSNSPEEKDDLTRYLLTNSFSRNNYVRSFCLGMIGATIGMAFYGPMASSGYARRSQMLCVFLLPAFYSFARGVWKDIAARALFYRAPTAHELLAESRQSYWSEKRRKLVAFPFPVSDRDLGIFH